MRKNSDRSLLNNSWNATNTMNVGRRIWAIARSSETADSRMSAALTHAVALIVPESPAIDARRETEHRMVWNQQEISDERELVHEITWIAELGSWRRFLRFQRKVNS